MRTEETATIVYVEPHLDDLYMVWMRHPTALSLNFSTFASDAVMAVEELVKQVQQLGFDLGPVKVCEVSYVMDMQDWIETGGPE